MLVRGWLRAERSIDRAVFGAVLLEKAARMTLTAAAARGGVADLRTSGREEALAKRDRCYSDAQVRHGWDHLVRQEHRDGDEEVA